MQQARRIAGALLATAALFGGVAVPAGATPVVRAHIALGCNPAASGHHRHHGRHASARCQAARLGHLLLAHAA
jgi:hypothetical protein